MHSTSKSSGNERSSESEWGDGCEIGVGSRVFNSVWRQHFGEDSNKIHDWWYAAEGVYVWTRFKVLLRDDCWWGSWKVPPYWYLLNTDEGCMLGEIGYEGNYIFGHIGSIKILTILQWGTDNKDSRAEIPSGHLLHTLAWVKLCVGSCSYHPTNSSDTIKWRHPLLSNGAGWDWRGDGKPEQSDERTRQES